MSYRVTAWRDMSGACGIDIGTRSVLGWDNVVAEVCLIGEQEVEKLIGEIRLAWIRAQTLEEGTSEPMPGPYDDGWD